MGRGKSRKWYVVWRGRTPGVYDTWSGCLAQVEGYAGAQYRGYPSRAAAEEAYESPYAARSRESPRMRARAEVESGPIHDSITVDAACNMRTGRMEYRGVYLLSGEILFSQGPFADTTNNVGEFLAIVHALAYVQQPGRESLRSKPIYTDSMTALAWIRRGHANTTMRPTGANAPLRELIQRAERWLRTHSWENRILKWETAHWGEIPADYGRK